MLVKHAIFIRKSSGNHRDRQHNGLTMIAHLISILLALESCVHALVVLRPHFNPPAERYSPKAAYYKQAPNQPLNSVTQRQTHSTNAQAPRTFHC